MELIKDDIDWTQWETRTEDAAHIKPASTWVQNVIDEIHNPEAETGTRLPWSKTHRLVRLRPAELSLWGGINGHKKSMLLGQVMLSCLNQGDKVCIASMEMPPRKTMKRITYQATGLSNPSPEFIRAFHKWTDGKLWLYDQTTTVNHKRMLALTRYCFEMLGIDHMVIDSLMKCGINGDDYNGQKRFIDELCSLAKDYNKHIHLVLHMRKGQSEHIKPDKFDVKGAGDITDQADNLFVVWDNKKKHEAVKNQTAEEDQLLEGDLSLDVKKQRHGEFEGSFKLFFNPNNLQHIGSDNNQVMDLCGLQGASYGVSQPNKSVEAHHQRRHGAH